MSDHETGDEPKPDPTLEAFALLAMPFGEAEVKQRSQGGRTFQYITARSVMNRLDDVLGPHNWWDEYIPGENSVLCKLTVRIPQTGEVITKQDAGGYAGMADQGDDDKSGYSDSFKRAAVKHGIGRYLYRDGVPEFARRYFRDHPDAFAAPNNSPPPQQHQAPPQSHGNGQQRSGKWGDGNRPDASRSNGNSNGGGQQRNYDGPPRSGKALFAWVKKQEEQECAGLLTRLNEWAKGQGLGGRMTEWNESAVAEAHAVAMRMVNGASQPQHGDAYEEPAY